MPAEMICIVRSSKWYKTYSNKVYWVK